MDKLNVLGAERAWVRWVALMCLAFFGLAVLSYIRLWIFGAPNLYGFPANLSWEIGRRTSFAVLMGLACLGFFKILRAKIEASQLKTMLWCSLLLQIIASFTLPLTSNDIFSNLAYGEMARLGFNTTRDCPLVLPHDNVYRQMMDTNWLTYSSVYGPIITLFSRLAVTVGNLWNSIFLYKLFVLIFSIGTTTLAFIFCKAARSQEDAARAFVYICFNPLFLWSISAQGHNDIFMIFWFMLFVVLLNEKYEWMAFLSLLMAAATKLAALPVLWLYVCYTFFVSKRRFAAYSLSLLAGGTIFLWIMPQKVTTLLLVSSLDHVDVARLNNSILSLLYSCLSLAGGELQVLLYNILWIAALLYVTKVVVSFSFRCKTKSQLYLFSTLSILVYNFLASPAFYPHYLTWVFPFAVALTQRRLLLFLSLYSSASLLIYVVQISAFASFLNCFMILMLYSWVLKDSRKQGFCC